MRACKKKPDTRLDLEKSWGYPQDFSDGKSVVIAVVFLFGFVCLVRCAIGNPLFLLIQLFLLIAVSLNHHRLFRLRMFFWNAVDLDCHEVISQSNSMPRLEVQDAFTPRTKVSSCLRRIFA